MRRANFLATTALVLALSATAAAAQDGPFSSVVVFGDSLSDNGNLSISLGLPRLRFTTNPGLVTTEVVAQRYGVTLQPSLSGGSNFAFGGAGIVHDWPTSLTVPTIPAQVNGYLAARPQADPNALYSIFGGNNDVFFHSNAIGSGRTCC